LVGQIELNQECMLIAKKKDAHTGSYRHFLEGRRPINLGKFKAPLSRDFF